MWKVLGVLFLLSGVAGALYSWTVEQKERQKRLGKLIVFLQKSVGVMEIEKIGIEEYFMKQNSSVLQEIARRLSLNTYPNGQMVWEEVFREEKQRLSFDEETYRLILQAGNGFFGKSRAENIRFLEKSISQLEEQKKKIKAKDAQERRVWVPVGLMGALMIVIILI